MTVAFGWRRLYDQVRRFTRTLRDPGAVSDDLIAWAFTEAEDKIHNLVMESGVPWNIKNTVVDDTATSFGTQMSLNVHRYFLEEDLGITDLAKVRMLWRTDPTNAVLEAPVPHLDTIFSPASGVTYGSILATLNVEAWIEDGDINASGVPDMALRLYNRYNAMAGGSLNVNYWFVPTPVDPDFFYEVNAGGAYTRRPSMHQKCWPSIVNYAEIIILETTEDMYKGNSLWRRFNGPSGVLQELRGYLSRFQTDETEYIQDTFAGEGI